MQYYPSKSIKTSHNAGLRRFKYLERLLGTLLHWVYDLESVQHGGGMCSHVWGPALFYYSSSQISWSQDIFTLLK